MGVLLFLVAACAPAEPPGRGGADSPLLVSLQVTPADSQVEFLLQVTNTSTDPIELNFTSGQSADFVVRRGDAVVWRWSDERMFTQALRSETLPPGESRNYEAQWTPAPELRGEFTAVGMLTAREHPVEQQTRFSLP